MKQQKILKKSVFVIVYVAVVLACILLDQLTKLWIFDGLLQGTKGNSVDVLGKFLRFEAVYNEGAAFGIGQSEGANIVFFVVTVLGLPLFSWLLWRSRTRSAWGQVGFAFIIGGTIGNAIDRAFVVNETHQFFAGKVRDFISFSIFPPVFNVADSFLVVGVVLAILAIVFFDFDSLWAVSKQEKAEKALAAANESEGVANAETNKAANEEQPQADQATQVSCEEQPNNDDVSNQTEVGNEEN